MRKDWEDSMTDRVDLKERIVMKCPFCGGRKLEIVDDCSTVDADFGPAVCCNRNGCGAVGPVRKSREKALAAWNARKK